MAVRSTSATMNGMLLWKDATRKSSRKLELLRHDPLYLFCVPQGLKVKTCGDK